MIPVGTSAIFLDVIWQKIWFVDGGGLVISIPSDACLKFGWFHAMGAANYI